MGKQSILVTGGAGMIGSNLVNRIIAEDIYNIYVVDDLSRGKIEHIQDLPKSNIFIRDLKNETIDDIIQSNNISIIVHLADIVAGIDYVFKNEYMIFQTNNLINTNVIGSARRNSNIVNKFINIGTACSFPKDLQNSLDAKLNETQLYTGLPESSYGMCKVVSCYETDLLSKETDVVTCNLLFHNVYGFPCDISEKSQVIPSLIKKAIQYEKEGDYVVWGSGNQGRAFLHVDDAVESIILAIQNCHTNETIQIGPDICTSIKDISNIIIECSNKDIKVKYDKSKPEGDIGRCADYTKAQAILNWSPKVSLNTGIKKLYKNINEILTCTSNTQTC